MAVIKVFNPTTETWEVVGVGARGPEGPQGPEGPEGPQGDSSVEVEEARVDTNGVTKPTLKERLDDDYNEVTAQLAQIGHYEIDNSFTTNEIQEVIDKANKIVFVKGFYNVDELILKSNLEIDFQYSTLKMNGGQPAVKSVLKLDRIENVVLKNVIIDGNRTENSGNAGFQDGGNHGISITSSHNIIVDNVEANNCGSDGLYLDGYEEEPTTNISILDSVFDNNMRQGCSIIYLENAEFIRCSFTNTNGKAPQAGIDIEPDLPSQTINQLRFIDCEFSGNAGNGFLMHVPRVQTYGRILFEGCLIENNGAFSFQITMREETSIKEVIFRNMTIKSEAPSYKSGAVSISNEGNINDFIISDSEIDVFMFSSYQSFTVNNTKLKNMLLSSPSDVDMSRVKESVFSNCIIDGDEGIVGRPLIWQDGNPTVSLAFNHCTFKNTQNYVVSFCSDTTFTDCTFINNHSGNPILIEPENWEDVGIKFIRPTILNNGDNEFIRYPEQTSGLLISNAITDKELPTPTANNKTVGTTLVEGPQGTEGLLNEATGTRLKYWAGSQAEYDAIGTYDAETVYDIW